MHSELEMRFVYGFDTADPLFQSLPLGYFALVFSRMFPVLSTSCADKSSNGPQNSLLFEGSLSATFVRPASSFPLGSFHRWLYGTLRLCPRPSVLSNFFSRADIQPTELHVGS